MNRAKQIEQIYRICNDIHQSGDYAYYIGFNSQKFIEVQIHRSTGTQDQVFDMVVHFSEGSVEDNQQILINKLLNFKKYGN